LVENKEAISTHQSAFSPSEMSFFIDDIGSLAKVVIAAQAAGYQLLAAAGY
jgi:hypothetical protein